MRGRSALILFLLAPLAACQQAAPLEVKDAWTRDTVGGTSAAAVYMTISSPNTDRLLAASSPVAATTDLMTMVSEGGAMGMTYLPAIEIPAGKPVNLDPTGLHIWLAALDRPLVAGQTFALTLRFEEAGEREVTVTVVKPADAVPGSGMDM